MFKSTSELQSFLIWCQEHAIAHVKVGEIEVKFSDYAYIDKIVSSSVQPTEERSTSKTLVDTLAAQDDEELLFYSARS